MIERSRRPAGVAPCRLRALPAVLLLLLVVPAAGLDTVWLVRHAEKAESWPSDRDLGPGSGRRARPSIRDSGPGSEMRA